VRQSESSVGTEEDNAAATAEAAVEIRHGLAGGEFGSGSCGNAIYCPFAKHQFHNGFAPAGERHGGREVVCVAAASDE